MVYFKENCNFFRFQMGPIFSRRCQFFPGWVQMLISIEKKMYLK